MVDRKVVASGIYDALEAADVDLRSRMPALFLTVDAIKSSPTWVPFAAQRGQGADLDTYRLAECAWCGDWFVHKAVDTPPECCSHTCHRALHRYRRRAECAWCGRWFAQDAKRRACCSISCGQSLRQFRRRRRRAA